MTAKEASLAAANLGIHQFIIPKNQSTNTALPFVINYANKDAITLLAKGASDISASVSHMCICFLGLTVADCVFFILKKMKICIFPVHRVNLNTPT